MFNINQVIPVSWKICKIFSHANIVQYYLEFMANKINLVVLYELKEPKNSRFNSKPIQSEIRKSSS